MRSRVSPAAHIPCFAHPLDHKVVLPRSREEEGTLVCSRLVICLAQSPSEGAEWLPLPERRVGDTMRGRPGDLLCRRGEKERPQSQAPRQPSGPRAQSPARATRAGIAAARPGAFATVFDLQARRAERHGQPLPSGSSAHARTRTHACTHARACTRAHTCAHMCKHTRTHAHMHMRMHTCSRTHTQGHTRAHGHPARATNASSVSSCLTATARHSHHSCEMPTFS